MTTEAVNILAIILGAIAVIEPFILSYMTNKLIQKEDERAKRMIEESKKDTERIIMETQKMIHEMARKTDEGNKRLEEFIKETQRLIDEGNKRVEKILEAVLKKV